MNSFLLVSSILFAGVAQTSVAEILNVVDSPSLTQYLALAGDLAADGPSMEAFEYSEGDTVSPQATCHIGTDDDLISYVTEIVKSMDWATDLSRSRLAELEHQAVNDLRELIGVGRVRICSLQFSNNYSLTILRTFESDRRPYVLTFREGYED